MRSVGFVLLALASAVACAPAGSREAAFPGVDDPVAEGGSDGSGQGGQVGQGGKGGARAGGSGGQASGGEGGQGGNGQGGNGGNGGNGQGGSGQGGNGGGSADASEPPEPDAMVSVDAPPIVVDTAPPVDAFVPRDTAPPDVAPLPPDTSPPDTAVPLRALMVVGNTSLAGTDMAIHARVAAKLAVDVVADDKSSAADATGKALVVITATVDMGMTSTKFRDVAVPVLLFEPNLLGVMQMTDTASSAHATADDETQVTILDAANPLAAGLTGNVTVYSSQAKLVWGVPSAAAIKVASLVGEPNRLTIFGYPAGAMMVGRTAPAKRVSFFIHDGTSVVNANGLKLLDAAIAWAIE